MKGKVAGAGAVIGLLMAILMAVQPSPSVATTSGDALYKALVERAAGGDSRSAELVAALDRYLAANNLKPADLGAARNAISTAQNGPVALRIRDYSPWAITVENVSTFGTRDDLDAYIAVRAAALAAIASQQPGATVEARLAPASLVGVAEFLATIKCDCIGKAIVADVFSGEHWLMSSMRPLGDDGLDADLILASLQEQAQASISQFPGIDGNDLRFTVRSITIETTAKSAQALADDPGLLLVDITNDLKAAQEGKAAFVEVRGGPDVFGAFALFALDNPFERMRLDPTKQEIE